MNFEFSLHGKGQAPRMHLNPTGKISIFILILVV